VSLGDIFCALAVLAGMGVVCALAQILNQVQDNNGPYGVNGGVNCACGQRFHPQPSLLP